VAVLAADTPEVIVAEKELLPAFCYLYIESTRTTSLSNLSRVTIEFVLQNKQMVVETATQTVERAV
jgi:HAMP domain-containing protein